MSKQIEVQVNGNRYPCRMTMGAMLRFKRETGKEVTEIDSRSVSDLCIYLWCCVVSACNADGVSFDLSLESFSDGISPGDLESVLSVDDASSSGVSSGSSEKKRSA